MEQLDEPATEYVPVEQDKHVEEFEAPVIKE
jgi:hypothetical protein